jgi:hypothetical protein
VLPRPRLSLVSSASLPRLDSTSKLRYVARSYFITFNLHPSILFNLCFRPSMNDSIKVPTSSMYKNFISSDKYLHCFPIALPRPGTFCHSLPSPLSNLPRDLCLAMTRPRQFCFGFGLVKMASSKSLGKSHNE